MYVLIYLCLILEAVFSAKLVSEKKASEFGKPQQDVLPTSNQNRTDMEVIMERQRQREAIRLIGFLTLEAIEDTKIRSEELTAILDKRLKTVKKLFKRLPFIVGFLVNRNELGVHLELPIMSRIFLMTSLGRGEMLDSELPTFFETYFKKMNASRSATEIVNMREFALEEMERLTRMIGNNYLGRTIDRVDSSLSFMQSELTLTRDMLIKLPELLSVAMSGPYDTVSEDRIRNEYNSYVKNSK